MPARDAAKRCRESAGECAYQCVVDDQAIDQAHEEHDAHIAWISRRPVLSDHHSLEHLGNFSSWR
jgi:hypothetical protein